MNEKEETLQEIFPESILEKEVEKNRTPSVQYALFNQDKILYEYRSGYADLKTMLKVDPNTTYQAFSITKTFTALSVLQLAEQHLIDIHKPVKFYLPALEFSENITIKQLLTHTAGIANPIPLQWIHLVEEHGTFNRNDFFNPLLRKHHKAKSKPGQKFTYSNLGYIILGQVIEAVTGETYEQYVTEHIIDKLQIHPQELGFTIKHSILHAKGYHDIYSFSMLLLGLFLDKSKYMGSPVGKWKPFKENYMNGAPYGGIIGTTHAFVKYGQSLLKNDSELISEEYKKMLFTENRTIDNKPTGMCLSWYTGSLKGNTYFTHAGGGGGYYCEIRLYPEISMGSFIVFNRSGFSDERFLDKIDKLFISKYESS